MVYKGYMDCGVDFVDEKVEELTGYPKREFDTRHLKWLDVLLPEDHQQFQAAFLKGLKDIRVIRQGISDQEGRRRDHLDSGPGPDSL